MDSSMVLNAKAYCYCNSYELSNLTQSLADKVHHTSYGNVVHVSDNQGEFFVFGYGVVVFWGYTSNEQQAYLDQFKRFANQQLDEPFIDDFTFSLDAPQFLVKNDHIDLPDKDVLTRLALSHGIAQSTKLSQFEERVQLTITDTESIPKTIAKTGESRLGRKNVAKLRGRLYITKSDILLNYDLLDVPDFIWENPEVESFYIRIVKYLDVKQRVDVLEKKLETIHELLIMMADELKHKHSSLLEWIIIWLIAIEIIIFLVHDIFKWL